MALRLSHHRTSAHAWNTPSSLSSDCIHMISAVIFAKTLYSDSVLDLEMVACFIELHVTRLEPRKIAKPLIERLSPEHPAQSASENSLISVEFDFLILKPTSEVCFRYLRILFVAVQC